MSTRNNNADSAEIRAFTEVQASTYTGMSVAFLRQDRLNGQREGRTPGPRHIKIGRSVRYLREDLDAWLDQFCSEAGKSRCPPISLPSLHA